MEKTDTLFFGSTTDSVIVFETLLKSPILSICCVVTQPPRPIGRKQIVTPTPVEHLAKEKNIPVLSFPSNAANPSFYQDEKVVIDALAPFKAGLIVSASYGQRIPTATITSAKYGGLNVHPSLLPRWRGADPVPWAIMSGDHQAGVTVVTLSEGFDEGKIIAQKKLAITPADTSDPLRARLFEIGAVLLIETIPEYISGNIKGTMQHKSDTPYAKRFTRDDGFESWEELQKSLENPEVAAKIDRKFRALDPWPGLWTKITVNGEEKRLKILGLELRGDILAIKTVQLEGKNAVSFDQFKSAFFPQ